MFIELSQKLYHHFSFTLAQRFSSALRKVLISTYINNILGSITAISSFTMIITAVLNISGYTFTPSLYNSLFYSSLALFFISIGSMIFLTREIKVEQMITPKRSQSQSSTQGDEFKNIVIPLIEAYMAKEQKASQNEKVEKLEYALKITTQVIQELELKVDELERRNIHIH